MFTKEDLDILLGALNAVSVQGSVVERFLELKKKVIEEKSKLDALDVKDNLSNATA